MRKLPVLYQEKSRCCGCTACVSVCPLKIISMVEDEEGFDYPEIEDTTKCIKCYKCISVCPIKSK